MDRSSTTTTAKKKASSGVPLSLNQRHNILIQDLSAASTLSKPHPHPPRTLPREQQQQPKFNLDGLNEDDDDDDVPKFSGIADFDSSPEVSKREKETKGDKRGNLKGNVVVSDEDDDDDDSVPNFGAIADFGDSPIEQKQEEMEKAKPEKVKIQGRRRLCKVSVESDDEDQGCEEEGDFNGKDAVDKIFDISDFSSPPRGKGKGLEDEDGGASEIRDILSNLSSRLEFLSIDKKRETRPAVVKAVPLKDDFYSVLSKIGVEQKKDELGDAEYASAGSSFAGSPELSDSSSCVNVSNVNKDDEFEVDTESDGDNFAEAVKLNKRTVSEESRNVGKKVNEKPVVSRTNFVPAEDDDADDCVVLDTKKAPITKPRHGGASSVVQSSDDEYAITLTGPKSTFKLSPKLGKMLYPHQRDGLKWLWSLHCKGKGGILGDDMGLGKTMQICGYFAGLFHSRLIKRAMVVAPKTLIPHWIKELSNVGLSKMIREYYGTCPKLRQYELQYVFQDRGILLTTYDIVRNNCNKLSDCRTYDDEDEDGPIWDYMVLDEGHLIKNPSTQRAKSLMSIPCAHRIVISGTPIQNNLKELWALFNFCCPDLLGDNKGFKMRYEHPIIRGNDKNATQREKNVGAMVAKELRERIQPYFLRRMKSEVFRDDGDKESAKLSKKNEITVWLRMTSCQRRLYEAFLKSEIVLSAFDGSPLAAITILKKICDHPYLLTKRAAEDVLEGMDSVLNQEDRSLAEKLATHAADLTQQDGFQEKNVDVSCKISFILSLLEDLIPKGHKVLIFSQTRKMLNLIQESLVTNGFKFLRIDGTTKASDRLKIVDEFQGGHGAPIFMLTSQVGGLGLTLTNADRVIVVDPAWNPSTDNQSVDRAYRIGQKKDVIVYRLMTCGTIEEKMYRMQVFKGGLFKTATEHKEQTRYFTQQDLKELFSLPKDGFDVSRTQLQLHEEHGHQIQMNDFLMSHLKFLESLGIGGVSHHSLLYSKSDPTPATEVEDDMATRPKGTTFVRGHASSSKDGFVDGSQYAFKPKDVNLHKMSISPQGASTNTESEIKERISHFSQLLSNKNVVAGLPDRGEKIRKKIIELNLELEDLRTPKRNEVIDLDDIADELQRSLRV